MRNTGQIHRVNIVYKPEGSETEPTEESISFSSKLAAITFRDRQKNLKNVISATYIGMEK